MKNFNPIRGTNDYMPRDAKVRELVKEKILNSYQSNGYNPYSNANFGKFGFFGQQRWWG